ncbi:hypothetical protein BC831DRAFT_453187 [Entophlyctis helioformis]|nr:hypothetical protein BC831DRAFT_453187 [Entophlyctis helioformis]
MVVYFGNDPALEVDKPRFDIAIEYVAAFLTGSAVLVSGGNAVFTLRRAYEKPTFFLQMIALYSAVMFLAQLCQLITAYFAINQLSSFFYVIFFGVSSYLFALTQLQTIRLVVPSAATAEKYIKYFTILHTVMHLIFAPPMYIIAGELLAGGTMSNFLIMWFYAGLFWWLYIGAYDCTLNIWVAKKMYEYGKTLITNSSTSASASTAGQSSTSIPLNEISPAQDGKKSLQAKGSSQGNLTTVTPRSIEKSAKRAMRKQYIITLCWLFGSLFLDIMSIFWLILYLLMPRVPGTVEARTGNAFGQLASANGGFHCLAASMYFQNIIALYQAKNARGSQKTKSRDQLSGNLSANNLASPPMSPPPVHSS